MLKFSVCIHCRAAIQEYLDQEKKIADDLLKSYDKRFIPASPGTYWINPKCVTSTWIHSNGNAVIFFTFLLRKSSTSSIRTRNWGYLKARLEDNGEKILLLIFYFILAFWKSDNFSSVCITACKHKKKTIDVSAGIEYT